MLRNDFDAFVVRLGDQNIRSRNDNVQELDVAVDEIVVHENYDKMSKQNDIALVRLKTFVRFTNLIRPACLQQQSNNEEAKALATGWGRIGNANDASSSDELLKVQLDILSINQCKDYFKQDKRIIINQNEICAGVLLGGRDSCLGGLFKFWKFVILTII